MLMYTPALPHDNGTQMQPQPRRQELTMGPTRSESFGSWPSGSWTERLGCCFRAVTS